ncbi:hypothetical protein KC640_01570 [Candidatus Dojkabacteria bacterium]|uniref:Uncharacterized protein n=1 Tax=Candidatus Dojkabacteria bacterium TaxID=2099670 RepID=A0A955ICY0_9BACT|nr:hypothetical protein [Candidatus Dojkabacteria bacterium]
MQKDNGSNHVNSTQWEFTIAGDATPISDPTADPTTTLPDTAIFGEQVDTILIGLIALILGLLLLAQANSVHHYLRASKEIE